MRITVKLGLIFALVWILIKMIFFWTQDVGYSVVPLVLINMLCIMSAISFGLYFHKLREKEETNALSDIKNGMTAGVPYAVLVSAFIFTYYKYIDPEYNKHQLAEVEYGIIQQLDAPGGLEKAKKENPDLEVLTRDEILEQAMDNNKAFYNPSGTSTLALLGLILLSTINSIFVTVVMRKVVFRDSHRKVPPAAK